MNRPTLFRTRALPRSSTEAVLDDRSHKLSMRGPAAMLALLLSVLIGAAPASALTDIRASGLGQLDTGKAAALHRSLRRASDEKADPADLPLEPAGSVPPAVSIHSPPLQPSVGASLPALLRADARPSPFRARAPPAA